MTKVKISLTSLFLIETKADQEFRSYQKEGKLTIEENPILWWFNRKEEYLLMIKLARIIAVICKSLNLSKIDPV